MNDTAYLIYYSCGFDTAPGELFFAENAVDAAEMMLSLSEEDIYHGFVYECIDDIFKCKNYEEAARHWHLNEALWYTMEVPVIHGDSCR